MYEDRYGNQLSTNSSEAVTAYIEGVDLYLSANVGADTAFKRAIELDPEFALVHTGLARIFQVHARGLEAKAALEVANQLKPNVLPAEQRHIEHMTAVIKGRGAEAFQTGLQHLEDNPRDVLIAQTYLGVFSLIGFSGRNDREQENFNMSSKLAPHYGDDWWFLSQHAFSLSEVGELTDAEMALERALKLNPRNANGAHHRAHLLYELSETEAGLHFLEDWQKTYDRRALMHNHISWHLALWALEIGDIERMWDVVDENLVPDVTSGPPLNVMTDMVSLLYRASLAGVPIPEARWQGVSDYAQHYFSKPGLAFADVHSTLAHAMAGDQHAFDRIAPGASGATDQLVSSIAKGFEATSRNNWIGASSHFEKTLDNQAAVGGSRAQRDLIELAWAGAMAQRGKAAEAFAALERRRPCISPEIAIAKPAN